MMQHSTSPYKQKRSQKRCTNEYKEREHKRRNKQHKKGAQVTTNKPSYYVIEKFYEDENFVQYMS